MAEGPRLEQRVNLSITVIIVPVQKGRPDTTDAIHAVTKEFSTSGVSVIVDYPRVPNEALLLFRSKGKPVFMRGKAKHLDPMGGGFYQCGFKLTEVLDTQDWPALQDLAATL